MEKRTGVKETDIDEFLRKAEGVEEAIRKMAAGEIKPEDVKVEGIDTPEEEAQKKAEKAARLAESNRKAEELRLKRKAAEKERWWGGAEFCVERKVRDKDGNVVIEPTNESTEKDRIRQRYTADYSRWNDWVPTDQATIEENELIEAEADKERNKVFEANNPEFCGQFLEDMEVRNKATAKKKEDAEKARTKGNKRFQRKEWDLALSDYMESLKHSPYEHKTLTNIAQVYIKQNNYDDALEFLSRTLYLDYAHAKALSRRAFIEAAKGDVATAVVTAQEALSYVKKETPPSKEYVDMAAQLRDLEVLAKEEADEKRLTTVMAELASKKTAAAVPPPAPIPTATAAALAAATPAAAPVASARAKKGTLTDFEAADQLFGVLGDISPQSSDGGADAVTPVSGMGNSEASISLLHDVTLRISNNQMLRVYIRKNGLIEKCVGLVSQLCTPSAVSDGSVSVTKMLSVLLHFLAAAIQGERASKLLLLPGGKTTLLLSFRDVLLPQTEKPELVYSALRVIYACCNDDTCTKTRDWVFSDAKLLGMAIGTVGQVLVKGVGTAGFGASQPAEDQLVQATLQGLAETAAKLVKEITFSTAGKEALAKTTFEVCALIVTGMAATLSFAMSTALMSDPTAALQAMLSSLGDESIAGDLRAALEKMNKIEENKQEIPNFDASLLVLEALLGCSQVEKMRDFFAGEIPWKRTSNKTKDKKEQKEKDPAKEKKEEQAQGVVEIIMHASRAAPELTTTAIAVLMNACLDHDGSVRNAVQAHGGLEVANQGLETLAKSASCESYSNAEWVLLCRQLGLLSRLAPLAAVQTELYKPANYRRLCRALKTLSATGAAPLSGSREAELHGHVVRSLAGLNKPSSEALAAGVEEGVVYSLLSVFPVPKKELNEFTPVSVTQMPSVKVSAVLIGNAARCLIPYADYEPAQKVLYSDRKLFGIEKIICSMATCTEMPVRQNLSVLLAKGCRVPGIRDVVSHFRGIQMMQELQVQGQYKLEPEKPLTKK